MKKILFAVAFFASASFALVACNGSDEPNKTPEDVKAITLSVDKNSIEANGEDAVNFTVTTDRGDDITGMQGVRIFIPKTETFLDGTKYTSSTDGTVTFQARYSGIYSNTVDVDVKNRSKYEKYLRRVLIMQLTGTWCVACPNMTRAIKTVVAEMPNRVEVLALHGSSVQGTDPYETPAAKELQGVEKFNISGFPAAVIDMRAKAINSSSSALFEEITKSFEKHPATCGVKISSTYNQAEKKGHATITVAATKTNKYAFGCAVVVDGLTEAQTGAENDPDYRHDNVVIAINNIFGQMIDDGVINADQELSHTFDFDLSSTKYNVDNMRVVAFILSQDGDAYYVNNSASCKLDGGSVDYALNEDK